MDITIQEIEQGKDQGFCGVLPANLGISSFRLNNATSKANPFHLSFFDIGFANIALTQNSTIFTYQSTIVWATHHSETSCLCRWFIYHYADGSKIENILITFSYVLVKFHIRALNLNV